MSTQGLATARTFLFVPGDRPDRFEKAASAGADVVVVDLEDGVPDERKASARRHVVDWLGAGGRAVVRINATTTPSYAEDVAALERRGGGSGLEGVVVPMAEDPGEIERLHDRVGVPILAQVESARGILRSEALAATPGVTRLGLGGLDLAVDVGSESPQIVNHARIQLVLASRAAGLDGPVDTVTTDVSRGEAAGADAAAARALGMAGKLCVHPRQVRAVAASFAPTSEEIAWASRVLEAATGGGVMALDGTMIDEPVVARARQIRAQADRAERPHE